MRNFTLFFYKERISVSHKAAEGKKIHKNRGFLSIERMPVLSIMAILYGVSLYAVKICRTKCFADVWVYIDASHTRRNMLGENFLVELRNRTQRPIVTLNEIQGGYESVYFFHPRAGNRAWIDSQSDYNQRLPEAMNGEEGDAPNKVPNG